MVRLILFLSIAFLACTEKARNSTLIKIEGDSVLIEKKQLLADFEVLLLCHCEEYFDQRVFQGASKEFLEENKGQIFGRYVSSGSHNQYYSEKFKKSLLFSQPYSVVWGTNYNYSRIDSLYFNPMYKHYISINEKTAHFPNQIEDINYIYDCFHKIKEIPLEKELDKFMRINTIE